MMLSESLGTKRGTRERGKKEKAVEIWEPNPVFFGGWEDGLVVVVFK